MSAELRQALEQVARRVRGVRLWGSLAACWLGWALLGAGLAYLASRPTAGWAPGWRLVAAFLAAASVSGAVCALLALRSARDRRGVARRVEAVHPELGTGLLAAVEEDEAAPPGGYGFLQSAVIRQALEHRRAHDWEDVVPSWTLRGTQVAHALGLACLLLALASLANQARLRANDPAALAADSAAFDVKVDPGNASIERGAPLLVVARFGGGVPADASLVVDDGRGTEARRTMTRSLEDPTFAGRVESVNADLAYRVEFQGRSSPTYRVKVFEYPELRRADARLVFPGYTAMKPKTVEDVRHVTAIEGTELTLVCRLNKDVKGARLVDEKGNAIPLVPQEGGDHAYAATLTLSDPRRYRVGLLDHEGRANKLTTEVVVNVTRNRPPVITMSQPGRDVRVSPVEELALKAEVADDFGVVRHGLTYAMAGRAPRDVVLKGPEPPGRKVKAEHLIDFESLKAEPDQLVTYFLWAEDVGPDGKPRRTSGDMYFAEVRPFEEVFRQGEQPPGGMSESEGEQGENAQAAFQLAELQKEIINGTWKLIRRETASKPSDTFEADGKVLVESQESAIAQAGQLEGRLRDPASKANLGQAVRFMKDAVTHLGAAVKGPAVASLTPALTAEQAAYQALLKLRDREFNVVRNNRRQRGGGRNAAGPSQRQLQQLELADEENRYEEQRSARAQQEQLSKREQEQRELRQVLNRLRELAQRQTDLNDRLKELQSALEAAKTPQAREEVERQLKRLREQQQEILRDTDELRERMEREENRDRMADARQQVEQGREHVRQASQALEEGRLGQAVTEGARAGRQLNDLREELRKRSSDRFSEEMTGMRDQARQLDEQQQRLSEQLGGWNRRPERSLRDTGERKQVKEGLDAQQKNLDQLLDRMRKTVQEAEETEPLLARELYDTVRKANEKAIPDQLKATDQLVDAGIPEEAARASRRAGEGLGQVREGVERAARAVLGDETAALRRAQGELDDLADQVNREIARATGRDPSGRDRNSPQSRQGGNGQERPQSRSQGPGQAGQDEAADRQGQDGEDQQGDRQGQQGDQRGQRGQQGQQKGQRQGQQKGQQGQQKGQQGQQGQQGQGGQQGQQGGQGGQPGEQDAQGDPGNPQRQQSRQGQGPLRGGGPRQGGGDRQGGLDRVIEGLNGGPGGPGNPITGEGFRQWSDRMRDVEELLDNPEMRAEAARIRDRVRGARAAYKRHSKVPDWGKLKDLVADPLRELRDRVAEEVRRRASPDALVPIDRDPVPPQFAEGVRRYYERLGSGR